MIAHGISGYKGPKGCRCRVCRAAQATYMREYRAGRRRRVDAGESHEHVARLLAAGLSIEGIATAAGIPAQTIHYQLESQAATMLERTADAILGVTLDAIPEHAFVSKRPGLHLIAAMEAAGIQREAITASVGWRDSRRWVRMRSRTLQRIIALYRYLAARGDVPANVLREVGAL